MKVANDVKKINSIEISDILNISHRKSVSHIKQCFKVKENEAKEHITWSRKKYKTKYVEVAELDQSAILSLASYFNHHSEMLQRASIQLKNKIKD